jgi:adenine-specific DNA-methyltransferase
MTDQILDVAHRGQVFTPAEIVDRMIGLIRRHGRTLEPACGDGAFLDRLRLPAEQVVAIENDPGVAPKNAIVSDFFAYPETERFDTIIGNPPYVKARDILPETARLLRSRLLNGHANVCLHFIEKCVRHLNPGGELIFITPRDFLKATGAARLNTWLYDQGTITDIVDLGDARIFTGAVPNCAIWRFEKGNMTRRTGDGRRMICASGQLMFTHGIYSVPLKSVFSVKVGGVSGADEIFTNAELGDADFVCSHTAQTGELRRMIFRDGEGPLPWLEQFKPRLLERRVTNFDESNWWKWGRRHFVSAAPRLYVNQKTRNPRPFFVNDCKNYDGAVLALFPHRRDLALPALADALNDIDWQELGFVCDGRFLFSQRSLEHAPLPESFTDWAVGL